HQFAFTCCACAVRTAEDAAVGLDSVTDDPAPAVGALRSQRMDRALEAVEGAATVDGLHSERLVVRVPAHVAHGHGGHSAFRERRSRRSALPCSPAFRLLCWIFRNHSASSPSPSRSASEMYVSIVHALRSEASSVHTRL